MKHFEMDLACDYEIDERVYGLLFMIRIFLEEYVIDDFCSCGEIPYAELVDKIKEK